ncbi:EAL domain-containing protein [Amphibacillus jilinensis]|uniref:EAL domain-containing protein n=1 Tax=Amphibacillus jilinensis TaxID=1216008 RepID=UPI0003133919|nr:EAL domain-containing protein [Amphibacillus jilinensis]
MLIDRFIDEQRFYHHFQPIYYLQADKCLGVEALLRSTDFPNPELAFEAARRRGRLYQLDTASIKKAITTFATSTISRSHERLFVNVLPSTLVNDRFPAFIEQVLEHHQLLASQIVFEISESERMDQLANLYYRIDQLKAKGLYFALDDLGKGYANFDVLIGLDFDYIKLDRLFSAQLQQSCKKKALIQFFRDYSQSQGIGLILEGIETSQEYKLACQLGVDYGQGYFLGRPTSLEQHQ